MKWQVLNSNLLDFMALLDDDALLFFELSLEKFDILETPFSIEINNHVSLQCVVRAHSAFIISFSYGHYTHLNFGQTTAEIDFIKTLENHYFNSNQLIKLSPKNKLKLLKLKR